MSKGERVSDETLNAFLDDELDGRERDRVFEAVNNDPEARDALCELRAVRDLMRQSYRRPPRPGRDGNGIGGTRRWLAATAAIVLMVTGGAIGWLAHMQLGGPAQIQTAAASGPSLQNLVAAPQASYNKVVLHVSSDDPQKFQAALDDAAALLDAYERADQTLQLELVANSGGLNLLRAGTTPYASRISKLSDMYDNLEFVACYRALERLRNRGVDVRLLPESGIASSGIEHIMDRMKHGWVYIKV